MATSKGRVRYLVCSDETVHFKTTSLSKAVEEAKAYFNNGTVDICVTEVVKRPKVTWED